MTDEEALKYLKNAYGDGSFGFSNLVSNRAIKCAIEALERQMPKKPVIVEDDKSGAWMRIDCPSCKAGIRPLQCFCDCCGQALDWR